MGQTMSWKMSGSSMIQLKLSVTQDFLTDVFSSFLDSIALIDFADAEKAALKAAIMNSRGGAAALPYEPQQ